MIGIKTWFFLLMLVAGPGIFLSSCKTAKEEEDPDPVYPAPVYFDLDSIKARGKLILLTENGPSTYYQYRGQARGFDFEMAKELSKFLGVKLEVRLLDNVDKMFEMLNRGEGDLIASNLTVTGRRKKFVRFTEPTYHTRQMLVQPRFLHRKPDSVLTLVRDTAELNGRSIWVHRYSSFYQQLKKLEQTHHIAIDIQQAPGEISTDDLIRLTSEGQLDMTVTDENLAIMQRPDYPDLDMTFAISAPEPIAWAVRMNSPKLQKKINEWLGRKDVRRKLEKTYNKYFREESLFGYKGPYMLPQMGPHQISPYDSLFKKYAPEIKWDWRLLAALCYQESRFNPNAVSWSGAFGLMQLMPETAARFGCDTSQRVEPNIRAGVKYIKHLERYWSERISDPNERIKFILASYNIGPGHIQDARNIARMVGKPDSIWDGHVAECLLLKSQEKYYTLDIVKHGYCHAKEPYHFVGKIMSVYNHYKEKIK